MQLALGGAIGNVKGGKFGGLTVVPKNGEIRFCGLFNSVKFTIKREDVLSYKIFSQNRENTELNLDLKDGSHFVLRVWTSYLSNLMTIIG